MDKSKLIPDKASFLELAYDIDAAALLRSIKMRAVEADLTAVAAELIEMVKPVARPKAVFIPMKVKALTSTSFKLGEAVFHSRVLGKVFEEDAVVLPYIITTGKELDALNCSQNDMLAKFRLDAAKSAVLFAAGRAFENELKDRYPEQRFTHINPGEIDDWPLTEQKILFALFKDAAAKIGVQLTEGCMIKPVKSRSGIYFANDDGFETCRLCTQYRCTGRRAAFDAATLARMTA
jgi:hypothetical protein